MAWALVQNKLGADGTATAVSTLSTSFASAVASGHLVVGSIEFVGAVASVTDDKSNAYNLGLSVLDPGRNENLQIFWLGNVTNGPATVTVHASGTITYSRMTLCEFSGGLAASDPSDGAGAAAYNAAATSISSGAFTTTVNGDLIYGATQGENAVITAGAGFTLVNQGLWSDACDNADEYQVQTTASSSTAVTFAQDAARAAVVIGKAFKPAAGGSTVDLAGGLVI